ncbi:MAG: hypothetical protein DRP42_01850 [Tenericutes bacterium]|nr:MAG: hypothetical protein DRP42_01850 [Mycoplasmatota bacterium]
MKLHDDLFDAMLAVYRIVALTEAISINSNLTGFLFGESGKGKDFNEQSINTRSENFEYEVKKRML